MLDLGGDAMHAILVTTIVLGVALVFLGLARGRRRGGAGWGGRDDGWDLGDGGGDGGGGGD